MLIEVLRQGLAVGSRHLSEIIHRERSGHLYLQGTTLSGQGDAQVVVYRSVVLD